MTVNNPKYDRYHRQVILKDFGEPAQEKLMQARVLVIGAGGLGCPALLYLAAAGIGTIGIVDYDVVTLTNLHRQVLFNMDHIGRAKAETAGDVLRKLNPEIKVSSYNILLNNANALGIIESYDIVLDGTDNFSSRYLINDACVLLGKPLISGAVSRYEGQVAVLNVITPEDRSALNYRDIFPVPPSNDEVPDCAEAGVLGVLTGIIGSMLANETIKLITGIGKTAANSMITFNALNNQLYEIQLSGREETSVLIPGNREEFINTDYDWLCSSESSGDIEIDLAEFNWLSDAGDTEIIDVREPGELPVVNEFRHLQIPLSRLAGELSRVTGNQVILFCQTGQRSKTGVKMLRDIFGPGKRIRSLKGGIMNLKNHQRKS
jgi:molybdopterin/thiamine biosynthesis adenylyltransferase/rhodanese-related sulfurtransferase